MLQTKQLFFVVVTVVKIHLSLNLNTHECEAFTKIPRVLSNDYCKAQEQKDRRTGGQEVKALGLGAYWRLAGSLRSRAGWTESTFSRNGDHFAPDTGRDKRYPESENSVRILPCKRTGSSSQSWHTKEVSRGFPKCLFSVRWKSFLWKMLELFTSARPVSLYIVCHGRLGVLIKPQPLHHLSCTPTYKRQTTFSDMPRRARDGRDPHHSNRFRQNVQNTCKIHTRVCKKTHTGLTWNVPNAPCGHFPHFQLYPANDWEFKRVWVIFIYLF